jgi:hypothetical protein
MAVRAALAESAVSPERSVLRALAACLRLAEWVWVVLRWSVAVPVHPVKTA